MIKGAPSKGSYRLILVSLIWILGGKLFGQNSELLSSVDGRISEFVVVSTDLDCFPSPPDVSDEAVFIRNVFKAFNDKKRCLVFKRVVYSDAFNRNQRCPQISAEIADNEEFNKTAVRLDSLHKEKSRLLSEVERISDNQVTIGLAPHVLHLLSTGLLNDKYQELLNPETDIATLQGPAFYEHFENFIRRLRQTAFVRPDIDSIMNVSLYKRQVHNEALLYWSYRKWHNLFGKLTLGQVIDSLNTEMGTNYSFKNEVVEIFDEKNLAKVKADISDRYQRDHVLVFKTKHAQSIVPKYSPHKVEYSRDSISAERLSDTCFSNTSLSTQPRIDIEGGNILVFDDLAIVGNEELRGKYVKFPLTVEMKKRLEVLGIDTTGKTESQLTYEFTDSLKSFLGVSRLFWFGNDTASYGYNKSDANRKYHQPIYHVDLFIIPVEFNAKNQRLSILIGIPNHRYSSYSVPGRRVRKKGRKINCELAKNIRKAVQKLQNDLKLEGIALDTLEIPLPLRFENTPLIERFSPICNGLVESTGGQRTYFMPRSLLHQSEEAESAALRNLSKRMHKIIMVEAVYGKDSGLRCRMVPLSRN